MFDTKKFEGLWSDEKYVALHARKDAAWRKYVEAAAAGSRFAEAANKALAAHDRAVKRILAYERSAGVS